MTEPVMAGDDENPAPGRWHSHCPSCCRVTTWAGFTDAHGCDVGPGCIECRYIYAYRGCELAQAHVVTLEEFTASVRADAQRKSS